MSCDVNALLFSGRAFQGCSEREQQAIIAQLLCDISQQGPPWAVVFPSGFAIGPSGVIDTTGTTTCGIQEAINSFPTVSLGVPYAGGGVIFLTKGVYTCTGQIVIPNQAQFNLRIEGVGKSATLIKYNGTASKFISTAVDSVAGPPGSSTLQFGAKSLGLTSIQYTNKTTLLWLGALNECDIDDVLFCPEACLAGDGACLNYFGVAGPNGVTGLRLIGDNMARVRNSAFWDCGRSIWIDQAHSRIQNCFISSEDARSNYSFETFSGQPVPKSFGVGLILGADCMIINCHFGGTTPVYCAAGYIQNFAPLFELPTYTSMVGTPGGGEIRVYEPNPIQDGGYTPVDKKIDIAGTITDSTDGLIVNFIRGDFAHTFPFQVIIGGNTIAEISNNGWVLRNLTKAQRNALSSPAVGLAVFQTDNTPGQRCWNGTHWVRYTETNDD